MILKVKFQENDSILKIGFAENSATIQADFGEIFELVNGDAPDYEGSYTVTPAVTEQVLATGQRIMRKDLVIGKIPFYKVSNISGGDTVTIG